MIVNDANSTFKFMVMLLFAVGGVISLMSQNSNYEPHPYPMPCQYITLLVIRMGTTRSQESSGLNRMTMAQTNTIIRTLCNIVKSPNGWIYKQT